MAISAITSSISPIRLDLLQGTGGAKQAASSIGTADDPGAVGAGSFSNQIMQAFSRLNEAQNTTDNLAAQAATGTLTNVQDYMVASNESQLMTQLTVAVRNKAVDAYNDIMRMAI